MALFLLTIGAALSLLRLIGFGAPRLSKNEVKIKHRSQVCVICASDVVGEFVILVVQVEKIESRWLILLSQSAPL